MDELAAVDDLLISGPASAGSTVGPYFVRAGNQPLQGAQAGYKDYRYGNSMYRFWTSPTAFAHAQQHCANDGGALARFEDMDEFVDILGLLNETDTFWTARGALEAMMSVEPQQHDFYRQVATHVFEADKDPAVSTIEEIEEDLTELMLELHEQRARLASELEQQRRRRVRPAAKHEKYKSPLAWAVQAVKAAIGLGHNARHDPVVAAHSLTFEVNDHWADEDDSYLEELPWEHSGHHPASSPTQTLMDREVLDCSALVSFRGVESRSCEDPLPFICKYGSSTAAPS